MNGSVLVLVTKSVVADPLVRLHKLSVRKQASHKLAVSFPGFFLSTVPLKFCELHVRGWVHTTLSSEAVASLVDASSRLIRACEPIVS